jgi:hypothetical protein
MSLDCKNLIEKYVEEKESTDSYRMKKIKP